MVRWRAGLSSDKLDTENTRELEFSTLLVCEGKADISFLMKLALRRGIGNLHFGFPTTDNAEAYGWTGLRKYFLGLPARPGFHALRTVAVIYDNDNDPNGAFKAIRESIDPQDVFAVPDQPLQLAAVDGEKIRVMFVPIPGLNVKGAIETLMLQSAEASVAALACVEAFAGCVQINEWDASHQAKMRLRSLIAATCRGNSDMTLTNIWSVAANPVNLSHACFDPLVDAVRTMIAAAAP